MIPFAVASLGLGILKAGYSYSAGMKAADQRKEGVLEAARRLRLENDYTLGAARAAGAASGVEYESASIQTYLGTMEREMRLQENLNTKAGLDEVSAMETAAKFNIFTDSVGSIFSFGKANNWFKTPSIT